MFVTSTVIVCECMPYGRVCVRLSVCVHIRMCCVCACERMSECLCICVCTRGVHACTCVRNQGIIILISYTLLHKCVKILVYVYACVRACAHV